MQGSSPLYTRLPTPSPFFPPPVHLFSSATIMDALDKMDGDSSQRRSDRAKRPFLLRLTLASEARDRENSNKQQKMTDRLIPPLRLMLHRNTSSLPAPAPAPARRDRDRNSTLVPTHRNLTLAPAHRNTSPAPAHRTAHVIDMDPEPVCPICDRIIIGDMDEINSHIDECVGLESTTATPENNSTASTAPPPLIRTSSLINIDEEDAGFGRCQYGEEDIERVLRKDAASHKQKQSSTTEEAEEAANVQFMQQILTTGPLSPSLGRLKPLIQSLLNQLATVPKCAVCWETLRMPAAASTNCWHVFCEDCWLRTLGNKRLCPQCATITNPPDLRRVFF